MKRIILSLIGALTLLGVNAQLTIERCQELARENYPLIRQYGLIEQSSKYTLDNLKHSWLPQVNLTAQATYQNETPSFPDQMNAMLASSGLEMQGLAKDQYRVQLDVSQKFFDGGKANSEQALTQAQDRKHRPTLTSTASTSE